MDFSKEKFGRFTKPDRTNTVSLPTADIETRISSSPSATILPFHSERRESKTVLTFQDLISKKQREADPVAMGSEDVLFAVYWSLINNGFPESHPSEFPRRPMTEIYDRQGGQIYDIAYRLVQIGFPGINKEYIEKDEWRQNAKVVFQEYGLNFDHFAANKLDKVWKIIQDSFVRNNVSTIAVTAYTRWLSTKDRDSENKKWGSEELYEDFEMFNEQVETYKMHNPKLYFVKKKGRIEIKSFQNAVTRYMVHLENIQSIAEFYFQEFDKNPVVAFGHLLRKLENSGVGIVTLEYDASGLLTDETGLTEEGEMLARKLLENGIVLDLAHLRDHVQGAVINLAEFKDKLHLLAYTHGAPVDAISKNSNSNFQERAVNRGISIERMKLIIENGGYIGFSPVKSFFNDLDHFLDTLNQTIIDLGDRGIGLALDMCGVPPEELIVVNPVELKEQVRKGLADRGHGEVTIQRILYGNHAEWMAN